MKDDRVWVLNGIITPSTSQDYKWIIISLIHPISSCVPPDSQSLPDYCSSIYLSPIRSSLSEIICIERTDEEMDGEISGMVSHLQRRRNEK